MGLKTNNYNVNDINLVLPTAYAQITHLSVDLKGIASAIFSIQQNRDMISENNAIETKHIRCLIDKEQPVHGQIYIEAKKSIFKDWEDDIVETTDEAVEAE